MESGELSTDREKSRVRLTGELQERQHEREDTSPVKGVADATGSPSGDLDREGLQNVLKLPMLSMHMYGGDGGGGNDSGRWRWR